MAVKVKINLDLKDQIKEKIARQLNDTVLALHAAVTPLTPAQKSKHGKGTRKGYTGGLLRRSWGIIQATGKGEEITAYLYNNVHYAAHVNFGHRTRYGTGKKKPKKNGKKYVEGQHFLERAVEQIGLDPRKLNKNFR